MLNVKFMVQKRQFRSHHDDEHYAAALFRYMREYAIMVKEHCTMVSIDDKHMNKSGGTWVSSGCSGEGKESEG